MDNKSILAGMIVLLVVVFLTQSKTFNRLIDTTMGRVVMLSMVLLASYLHQLLGVIVLFFIILMINKTDILEGFSGGELTPSDYSSDATSNKKEGKSAYIIAKMNSLVDNDVIKKLYDAKAITGRCMQR